MDTSNTVIGKDGYPFVVNSGGHGDQGYNNALAELITNNNIADNSRAVLGAICDSTGKIIAADGVNAVANLEATNRNGLQNLKATGDAAVAVSKTVYDGTVSTTKAVTDGSVSTTKTVTDYGIANAETTNRNATAVTKAITDASLASSLGFGELREVVAVGTTANAIASKDIQIAIYKDGCETRETVNNRFYTLNTEMLKGFSDNKYDALKNKCDLERQAADNKAALAAQIAECCCEQKQEAAATRALILSEGKAELERRLAKAETQLLILSGGIIGAAGK